MALIKCVDGNPVEMTPEEEAAFEAARAALRAEFPEPTYRDKRRAAYGVEVPLGDQLDALRNELVARGAALTTDFAAVIAKVSAIKSRFPKS